jgi:hypothetical protein
MLTLKAPLATGEAVLNLPLAGRPGEGNEEQAVLGWMALDVEALKRKSFAACTAEELAALRRIMASIRLTRRVGAPGAPRPPGPAGCPTCAGRCASPCACTATRPSCCGGSAGCGCGR